MPVEPFTTNKQAFRDPSFGVESLGTEMSLGKWIIPCDHKRRVDPQGDDVRFAKSMGICFGD